MTKENFYQIQAKAVEELEEAIAAELKVEDPPVEQARAILSSGVSSSGNFEGD